jgi:hypothetical protein
MTSDGESPGGRSLRMGEATPIFKQAPYGVRQAPGINRHDSQEVVDVLCSLDTARRTRAS